MTEHKTFPGKVYTVSCAEDTTVVLPDPLGVKEAVVLECTAGQQLHVTATAGRLETSSDQAIVTELFKLAPCRGVAAMMLLRKAGGWLPKGFTELEYLEASGTQYLLVDEPFNTGSGVSVDVHLTDSGLAQNGKYFYIYALLFNLSYRIFAGLNGTAGLIGNEEYGNHGAHLSAYSADGRYTAEYNYRDSGQMVLTTTAETKTKAITAGYVKSAIKFPLFGSWQEDTGGASPRQCSQRLYCARITQGASIARDLIPALRNADGVAGMFDTVNKTFYTNAGTGVFGYRIKRTGEPHAPMSLRDPWRVDPSGVYARLVAENALEILADTEEISGDGWERFANTAEAYEHFGIVPQEEELLTE